MQHHDRSIGRRAFMTEGGFGAAAIALSPAALLRLGDEGFAPPIGVCRPVTDADAAKAAGVAYLEVSCREWLVPELPQDDFELQLARLRASAVPARAANGFLPGALKSVGPEADHERILDYARTAFRRAAEVGIGVITFGSGRSRRVPARFPSEEAERQLAALLTALAPAAQEHDVLVCVEPLQSSEANLVNRVSEAQRIVEAVNHPQIAITADVFHMLREKEEAEAIRKAGPLIRHVHIAEARKRTPPGYDGDDFTPYLKALRDIDYQGLVSIECGWSNFTKQAPGAVKTLRDQMEALT